MLRRTQRPRRTPTPGDSSKLPLPIRSQIERSQRTPLLIKHPIFLIAGCSFCFLIIFSMLTLQDSDFSYISVNYDDGSQKSSNQKSKLRGSQQSDILISKFDREVAYHFRELSKSQSWKKMEAKGKMKIMSELSFQSEKQTISLKFAYHLSRYQALNPTIIELKCKKSAIEQKKKATRQNIQEAIDDALTHYNGTSVPNLASLSLNFNTLIPEELQTHQVNNGDKGAKPPLPLLVSEEEARNETIFVGISSYRDYRCGHTIQNLFREAAFPYRVNLGVVDQISPGDAPCINYYCRRAELFHRYNSTDANSLHQYLTSSKDGKIEKFECPFSNQITFLTLDASRFNFGPVVARARQGNLIKDETFCLQCDAHSALHEAWDFLAIQEFTQTQNELAVLTTYPNDMKPDMKDYDWDGVWAPRIEGCDFTPDHDIDLPRNHQAGQLNVGSAGKKKRPVRARFYGAGVAFSKCHGMINVRNDPSMKGIFDGEEFSLASRLWTSGYDLYTPWPQFVVHDYEHKSMPLDPELKSQLDLLEGQKTEGIESYSIHLGEYRDQTKKAQAKLKRLFHYNTTLRVNPNDSSSYQYKWGHPLEWHDEDVDFGIYGMGERRSYYNYVQFSGMNTINHTEAKMLDPDATPEFPFIRYEVPWNLEVYATGGRPESSKASWSQWLIEKPWSGLPVFDIFQEKHTDKHTLQDFFRSHQAVLYSQENWLQAHETSLIEALPFSLSILTRTNETIPSFTKQYKEQTVEWLSFVNAISSLFNVSNHEINLNKETKIQCSISTSTIKLKTKS